MTAPDQAVLVYSVIGGQLVLPDRVTPSRADGLWQTTCLELFAKPRGSPAYVEYNFSPSTRWAAYSFQGYRQGGRDLTVPADPQIEWVEDESQGLRIQVDLDLSTFMDRAHDIGLSAVIEETDGTKSYWALMHSNPDKPDFHDPACFILELSPPRPA